MSEIVTERTITVSSFSVHWGNSSVSLYVLLRWLYEGKDQSVDENLTLMFQPTKVIYAHSGTYVYWGGGKGGEEKNCGRRP